MAKYRDDMKGFLTVAKALADEGRVRALLFLAGGELCVCQIIEMLELAPSTVSKHMAILHQAGLVETRRQGRWIYYRLAGENAPPCVRQALAWATECLGDDAQLHQDARRLRCVRKTDPKELCCAHYKS